MELKTIIKDGYKLVIHHDEFADSPRDWYNLGTMVTWHRSYVSPDTNDFREPTDFIEWWQENGKDGVLMPVYILDHSSVSFSTTPFNESWDSGLIGYIYATAEDIKESGVERDLVKDILTSEVDTYSQWANGNVYGYELSKAKTCDSCQHVEWVSEDSGWEYVGGLDSGIIPEFLRPDVLDYLYR